MNQLSDQWPNEEHISRSFKGHAIDMSPSSLPKIAQSFI